MFGFGYLSFVNLFMTASYVKGALWLIPGLISWNMRSNIVENSKNIIKEVSLKECGRIIQTVNALDSKHEYVISHLREPN